MYLSLKCLFDFVKCTTNSRNAVEGEEVLRAKQIILCGKVQRVNLIFISELKYKYKNVLSCKICFITVAYALLTIEEWFVDKSFSYKKFSYS